MKVSCSGVAIRGSYGVGESWCVGVAVWGSCGVGGVAVWGSSIVGSWYCGGDTLCWGNGDYQT